MKSKIVGPIPIALFLAAAAFAQTQLSLNEDACGKLKKADTELNRVYQQVLAAKSADRDFVKAFREAEAAWIAFRDAHVKSLYPDPGPRAYGSVYPMCRCGVLEQLTVQRAKEIQRLWVDGVEEGDACTGSCAVKTAKLPPAPQK